MMSTELSSAPHRLSEILTLELMVENTELVHGLDGHITQLTKKTWQSYFERWLIELAPEASPINAYELSLVLTNDAKIQQLNSTYRHQERSTDVLAFAALETPLPGSEDIYQQMPLYLGDIVISVETAVRQANEQGHAVKQELTWLATHGLLHLLGWDHPDAVSLEAMLAKQTALLALIS